MPKNSREGVIRLKTDIASALNAGRTNKEIMALLHISETTLITHKRGIVNDMATTLQEEYHFKLIDTVAKHEKDDNQIITYCNKVIANCSSLEEYNEKLERTFALRGDARADLISLYSQGAAIIGINSLDDAAVGVGVGVGSEGVTIAPATIAPNTLPSSPAASPNKIKTNEQKKIQSNGNSAKEDRPDTPKAKTK